MVDEQRPPVEPPRDAVDEPSIEDFEPAEEEGLQLAGSGTPARILRAVGVLLLVVALLLYFVAPYYDLFRRIPNVWRPPSAGTHAIPLAPKPAANPKRSV